jgi:methionyl-tRNA formyltransferase
MKIAFFGSPAAARPALERLIQAGHSIELVVTQPDRPSGRGRTPLPPPVKELALRLGLPCLQPTKIRDDEHALQALQAASPDINVVVAFGQIMPPSIIYLPAHNSVNVHFSLLPRYRGAAPVQWAILNGEEKTGVTIFELNEKMDEGDILTSQAVEIYPSEYAKDLEKRLSLVGADLLVRTLAQIDHLPRIPQEHSTASYAPRLKKEQGQLDWTRDALSVERMVRAFSPWPGAFTFCRGQRLIIHVGRAAALAAPCSAPGRIVEVRPQGILVCCGSGTAFQIERLQRENKREMPAVEFLRGLRLDPGERLG